MVTEYTPAEKKLLKGSAGFDPATGKKTLRLIFVMYLVVVLLTALLIVSRLVMEGVTLESLERIFPLLMVLVTFSALYIFTRQQFLWASLVKKLSAQTEHDQAPHN